MNIVFQLEFHCQDIEIKIKIHIQRREIKTIKRFKNCSYRESLEILGSTIALERMRGDIIETFKIIYEISNHGSHFEYFCSNYIRNVFVFCKDSLFSKIDVRNAQGDITNNEIN